MSDRRERILEVARDLFPGNGYKTTSIQQIADACNISKGAFYLHFRSKDELLMALIERIEEEGNERIGELRNDPNLNPKEKLNAYIRFQINDMIENRDISQIFMQETGLSLNEEVLTFIRKSRFNWQSTQEGFLLEVYGADLKPYVIDAAIALNGVLNEYYSIVILENVDVDVDHLVEYLTHFADHIANALIKDGRDPVFTEDNMPSRKMLEAELQRNSLSRARDAFEQMQHRLEKLQGSIVSEHEVTSTMELIDSELQKDIPNKFLIQGMLANLRDLEELDETRALIARELDIKLI